MIINIFGSSGSGTTTLAETLAQHYHCHHIDIDDYMWEKTDPPFTVRRDNIDIKNDLNKEINKHKDVIISGSLVNIYDDLKAHIDLFIYINLDIETRIERINKRELGRFGDRILPGGDLFIQHQEFLTWVSDYEHNPENLRSRRQHLLWLEDVSAPVLRITDALSIDELLKLVKSYIKKL